MGAQAEPLKTYIMAHCNNCNKEYDTKDVSRIYGAESRVLIDGFCSAICYTLKSAMGVKTARESILERIAGMKVTDGFTKGSMRWQHAFVASENTHISVLDFNTLTDPELVFIFEYIVRQYNKQM